MSKYYIIVLLAAIPAIFYAGHKAGTNAAAKEHRDALVAAINESQAIWAADLAATERAEVAKTEIREVIRHVTTAAETVATPECERLGDGFLQLYNAAIKAASPATPTDPAPVPAGGH